VEVAARRTPEHRDEHALGELGDLTHRPDPALVQLLRRDGADAPEPLDRQRMQEGQLAAARHHEQAIGLGHAAGHLGEELRPRHPDGDRQADALEHVAPQPDGDLHRRARDPP
jgi:hypothetical protein